MYAFAELALKSMPFCRDAMEPLMAARGHPLSFLEDGDDENIDTSTPWGLGRAYANEMWDYLAANDGWNSDGSLGGKEFNRIPFSGDFTLTDSQGNAWTPYIPRNTPYRVSHLSDGKGSVDFDTPHERPFSFQWSLLLRRGVESSLPSCSASAPFGCLSFSGERVIVETSLSQTGHREHLADSLTANDPDVVTPAA